MKDPASVPKQMRPIFDALVSQTDAFCAAHLDEEYAQLCRELAAALCRKRPSPLAQGKLEVWACSLVYALGRVNFLFDRSQTPHMSATELCALWGVGASTAGNKAKRILESVGARMWDTRWTRPSKLGDHPYAWLISINGFALDARHAPREIQEEALRLGLVPYLP
ncbi:MAG: hypothetical protein IVW57_11905 [Ktedonobacterales bacterium]|nr:hypothetical protein [Ktedonobacterales bacterium]